MKPVRSSSRAPASDLASALVAWYRRHARTLPWRSDPTPYKVLLSELMLQQTRVETVRGYFARFLDRWPTLEALAEAEEAEVLGAWAGLGYYARARNLHRAAQEAVRRGGLPEDPAALRELPGIGPYTAGAIASIAFDRPAPLVDGNVERVLSRVDARAEDPRRGPGRRALWERADALVQEARPRELNQALMELGALVCTPRSPSCGACPWASPCLARAAGDPEALPNKAPRKKPVPVRAVAGVLRRDGALLMGRRPPGLLGGLWEPLTTDGALAPFFAREVGVPVEVGPRLGEVVHVFTHRRLTLEVFAVEAQGAPRLDRPAHYRALAWGPADLPLSKLTRKVLALL